MGADKGALATLMALGASFFAVDVHLDELGKCVKVPRIRGWQKSADLPLATYGALNGAAAYGFHPETIGAIVIDLDDKGTDGEASLLAAIGPCPEVSNPLAYVDSPNGRHLYFSNASLPEHLRRSMNGALPGVDIRGGHSGGWLVAPGSVGWSYKRREWLTYLMEGDFSDLPEIPAKLRAFLERSFASAQDARELPGFLSPATPDEAIAVPDDPGLSKLFEVARFLERSPAVFALLVRRHVPQAVQSGADFLTGNYDGDPGQSCKWATNLGVIKDFADPGKGGDFLWWLGEHRHLSPVEAAREVLSICGVTDPSAEGTLREAKKTAQVHANAGAAGMTGSYALTDSGNAERYVAVAQGRLAYNIDRDVWMAWTGQRWSADSAMAAQAMSKEVCRSMARQVLDDTTLSGTDAKALMKWAILSESATRRGAMVALARSEPGMSMREADLDADPDVLNTHSGMVNLKTGEVMPHDRKALATRVSPYKVETGAPTAFLSFLDETFQGNRQLIDWIHSYLGYCLTGRTSAQIFPIWWGGGANGKSVLLHIVGSILGDYCQKTSTETWLQNHSGSPVRDDLAALRGARFVWASEPDAGKSLSMQTIKEVSGGDPVTCRHLYGRLFTYTPTYKTAFVTNHRPNVKSQDDGTWRRIKFVPFLNQIAPEDRIPDLGQKILEAEGGKILAWMIEGAMTWYEDGKLPTCLPIEAATAELKDSDDPLSEWVLENCVLGEGRQARFDQLWDDYSDWIIAKKIRNFLPRQAFRRLMLERKDLQMRYLLGKTTFFGIGMKDGR